MISASEAVVSMIYFKAKLGVLNRPKATGSRGNQQ